MRQIECAGRTGRLQSVAGFYRSPSLSRGLNATGLMRNYVNAQQAAHSMCGEADRFLELVCHASGLPDEVRMTRPNADVLKAETARLGHQELYELLVQDLKDGGLRFATAFEETMDKLVERGRVGLFEQHGDACRFGYFRGTIVEEDGRRLRRNDLHVHDLVKTRIHPIHARVAMPEAGRLIVKAMPRWLQPEATIVTGRQIREVKTNISFDETMDPLPSVERESLPAPKHSEPSTLVRTARQVAPQIVSGAKVGLAVVAAAMLAVPAVAATIVNVFLLDPAIVVGGRWVLYGWNEGEE